MIETVFRTVVQAREDIGIKKENLCTTSLMRVYEVMDFKKRISGRQTNKAILEQYEKIKFAKGSEVVKSSFIEVASMLSSSCLNVPEVVDILMSLDEREVNPLDSVYKLREVCLLCDKKPALQVWAFAMLADNWVRTDAIDPIPIRLLKDSGDHYSLVKLTLFKRQLRDYLWREMDSQFSMWDSSIRSDIRRLTESLETVRNNLGFFSDKSTLKSYPARGSWPASADAFLLIFEAVVFDYIHDEVVKQLLKNHRGVDDVMQHKDIRLEGTCFGFTARSRFELPRISLIEFCNII